VEGVLAGATGDKINAFPDTGHAAKIKIRSKLLAGRAAQTCKPLVNIWVNFFNGFCRDADLEGVGAMGTSGFIKIL
jgi:hypothetical protein